jgi:hypothetical protein
MSVKILSEWKLAKWELLEIHLGLTDKNGKTEMQ